MNNPTYTSPQFNNAHQADVLAHQVLQQLNGLSVAQVRQVLQQATFWLDATTKLDCEATEFQQAVEGYQHAAAQSV